MTSEPALKVRSGLVALAVLVVQMVISITAWSWIAGADYMSRNEIQWWFLVVGLALGATVLAAAVLAFLPRLRRIGLGLLAGSLLAVVGDVAWLLADVFTTMS